MRVSREEAAENRRRVVDTAGELFRQHGFDGIGIADLMQAAGLTHGGFYKQFGSKADLEAEASAGVLKQNADLWSRIIARDGSDPLGRLLAFYLAEQQLSVTRDGCGMATLGPDAARRGGSVQAAFGQGIDVHVDQLARVVSGGDEAEKRRHALVALSQMVGALVLARAAGEGELAGQLLETARDDLMTRFAE